MKLTKRQLNAALKKLADASTTYTEQRALIDEHCKEVYGCDTGGCDNDEFIDSVGGGCGVANGMTAEEFHISMIESIKLCGIEN